MTIQSEITLRSFLKQGGKIKKGDIVIMDNKPCIFDGWDYELAKVSFINSFGNPEIKSISSDSIKVTVEGDNFKLNYMNFSDALQSCIAGAKISREGWNGKNMFVTYSPANHELPKDKFWSPAIREYMTDNNIETLHVEASLTMKSAQDTVAMGWRPTSADMLSTDWLATPIE